MNERDEIISGFSSKDEQMPFAVDFSLAKCLDRAGTTCDTFECTIQHRHLFVKRLKGEYHDIPLYRAAFEKEYELGVSLNHTSLPRYVGFGEDYIVMDFIEGDTLSDLIKRDDPRLKSKRFVRRLLGELIDVVEYLHNRNVVHCDIKPDNIIISPHSDRPLTLIDLDKAYTSWLETTHGNTDKYGCKECADGQIDFKGIGLIAGKLGMKRIAGVCDKGDVTAESLRKGLDRGRKGLWLSLIGIVVVSGVILLFYPYNKKEDNNKEDAFSQSETIPVDTLAISDTIPTVQPTVIVEPQKPVIDRAWISRLIAEKTNHIRSYREKLWRTLESDTIPISKKWDAIYDYTYSYGMAHSYIISTAVTHYPEISELDVQMAVRKDPAWIRLEKDEEENQRRIQEFTKSQRSSNHPASLPDKSQDASLLAPHQ